MRQNAMKFAAVQKSIDAFKKLPGMGPRHATRCVFYLLKTGEYEFKEFVSSLVHARSSSLLCATCFRLFEIRKDAKEELSPQETTCDICSDPKRTRKTIMVVENDQDLAAMERLNTYRGTYLTLRNFAKKEKEGEKLGLFDEERIRQISQKLKERGVQELILATNPTVEGNSFAFRIKAGLDDSTIKITRLARGLPTGAEIEYADEETLKEALEGRK